MNRLEVEDVREALRELGVLREARDWRVAVDFHAVPQYHWGRTCCLV